MMQKHGSYGWLTKGRHSDPPNTRLAGPTVAPEVIMHRTQSLLMSDLSAASGFVIEYTPRYRHFEAPPLQHARRGQANDATADHRRAPLRVLER